MPQEESDTEVLYDYAGYTLERLGDNSLDAYAIQSRGLYTEFSTVERLDRVYRLYQHNEAGYSTVAHSTGDSSDVTRALGAYLDEISRGDDPSERDRQFAYGASIVDGVEDPLAASGFDSDAVTDENPWYGRVADQYDTLVRMMLWELQGNDYDEVPDNADVWFRENTSLGRGIIDEPLARRCWFRAIYGQDDRAEGWEVAEELGWVRPAVGESDGN